MIWEEIKKIWQPRTVLIVLGVSALLFVPLLAHFYDNNGRFGPYGWIADNWLQTGRQIVEQYGTELSDEEYEQLCEQIEELGKATGDKTEDTSERLKVLEEVSQSFQSTVDILRAYPTKEAYMQRLLDAFAMYGFEVEWSAKRSRELEVGWLYGKEEVWRNIMFSDLLEGASDYFGNTLTIIAIALCILLSPLLVRDRMCHIRQMQFGSRMGKRVLWTQFVAVMLSAAFLTTVYELVLGGALFLRHGLLTFSECRLYSFIGSSGNKINCTYMQYIWILISLSYLISIGTAGILFFLSQYSKTYIGMILKMLPVAVIAYSCYSDIIHNVFLGGNEWTFRFQQLFEKNEWLYRFCWNWTETTLTGIIFFVGAVLGVVTCLQVRKKEV